MRRRWFPTPTRSAAAAAALTLALASGAAAAQEPHPQKAIYADHPTWPSTAPGEVELKHFRPFRAVYDRQYTQGSGPAKGEKRQDQVIVDVHEVGWDGQRAASITMIDTGSARHADTAMRTTTMVAGLHTLGVLFEIGPVPGKAKDYYLARFTEEDLRVSTVMTETQELKPQKVPVQEPGFGPGAWVMASMKLKEGMKINLAPYYSPRANPISQSSYGRVIERTTIADGAGREHEAWVVETSGWYGLDGPKVLRMYLQESPPYYLGTEIYNYDTDERKRFVWLRSAQLMER